MERLIAQGLKFRACFIHVFIVLLSESYIHDENLIF